MPTRPPSFSQDTIEALAASYPDQNIIGQSIAYDPTDVRSTAAFSTNHMSAYANHAHVSKAYAKEQKAGRCTRMKPTPPAVASASNLPDWISNAMQVWPATQVPSGATTKTNADGTVRADEMRITVDYSWPVPGIALARQVCSPNGTIDLDALPGFEWFRLRRYHEQVWYLKQLGGLDLE